jgi:hypothetical protein
VIENLTLRVVLLSVVFVTDLVMVIGLVREELRDWRLNRSASGAGSLLKIAGDFSESGDGGAKGTRITCANGRCAGRCPKFGHVGRHQYRPSCSA